MECPVERFFFSLSFFILLSPGKKGICETSMLRKKVLSVSPTKATLLVEESATGHLKVLRRVNTSSWSAAEVEEAQRLYGVLAQTPIPVLVETDNVVFQSAYLNVVTPHFVKGELASHVRASPQQPPTDAQIARWIHVIALGIQSVHRLGFVHGALKLTKVYLTDDRGAAGIVLGSPLPLPLYREALDNARAHAGGGGMGAADGQHHHAQRHFYNDDESRNGGTGGVSSSTSLHSNISINSLELNYPPEVLHSAANRELHYTAQSDVWHLGAMLMALAAAHGQLQHRSSELHSLVNDMCDDEPDRRVTLPEIIRRLVAVQSAGAPRLSTAAPTTTTIEAPPHQHHIAANTTSRATGSLPLPGELQPSSIDRSEAYTTVDEDEEDDGSVEPVRKAAERSPDPLDPRLATQRYVPPPPLVLKKQSTVQTTQQVQQRQLNFAALDATQQHSNTGIVLTPRGGGAADLQQRAPPKELIGSAAGGPRRTPSAAARAVQLTSNGATSQRSGRMTTPVRAHSKPAGGGGITPRGGGAAAGATTTAVRQAQNANSAYLIHAFERQEAELQRRRDEQTRDAAKRREELASMKEAADAAHRQHVDNLRRIHKKHDNEHRGDIRKSIKLWQQRQGHSSTAGAAPSDDANAADDDQHHDPQQQQQQQHRHTVHSTGGGGIVLDDGHGVVVFATAEAPPSRSTARRQTQQVAAGHESGATAERDRRIADSADDDRVDDPNVVNYVVSPRRTVKQLPQESQQQQQQQRLQHRTESIEEESSTVLIRRSVVATTSTVLSHTSATAGTPDNIDDDDDDERNMPTTTTASSSYDTASNVVGSPMTPLSATVSRPARVDPPTAFEITPPRKRRVGAAAEVSAPAAAGGVAPFQHHLRHATTSDTLQSPPQGLAPTTQQQRHSEVLAGGATAAQQSLSDPPRPLNSAGVSATNHRDPTPVTSGRPTPQHSRSILDEDHVSASAALEWTVESLRRSLTHGPWRSLRCSAKREDLLEAPGGNVLLVSRLLHLVDEFICLPAKARVQLKENAQLFERVRRLVLESRRPSTTAAVDDGKDEAEDQLRKEGLFAVVAPLVCQLVAVEGALALSRELRGGSSNDDEGQ
jgi:serine/threonine protein kinase